MVQFEELRLELLGYEDKLKELFQTKGVCTVTAGAEVRDSFTKNTMLFGGVIMVGSLEDRVYQNMRSYGQGFGVVPVPVYREGDSYLTQIHVVGRAGGIARGTKKFVQCSAFLQYQTEHSTDILNEYYDYNLQYKVVDGEEEGTVRMLQYIRKNVRSAFDKTYDDAIGFYFKGADANASKESWAGIISDNAYVVTTMRSLYLSNTQKRVEYLNQIIAAYERLPE